MNRISVIVPVYAGEEVIPRCLSGIMRCSPPPHEIIVVSNGDEPSAKLAESVGAKVLRIEEPVGPALARNAGARAATGNILFFVDADVEIHPDAIGEVTKAFDRDPGLASVFGSYDDSPAAPNFLSQYKNLFHHYVHQKGHETASTFWSGCGAVRREIFLALNGFDTKWFYIEDIEFGYRAVRAGHRIANVKTLQGKHLKHWTLKSLLYSDIFCRALPWTELMMSRKEKVNDLNIDSGSRLNVIAAYIALACIAVGLFRPAFLWGMAGCFFLLFILNIPLYSFFFRKKGPIFTLGAIPWHWFYLLYGGAAFLGGILWGWSGLRPFHTTPYFWSWDKKRPMKPLIPEGKPI